MDWIKYCRKYNAKTWKRTKVWSDLVHEFMNTFFFQSIRSDVRDGVRAGTVCKTSNSTKHVCECWWNGKTMIIIEQSFNKIGHEEVTRWTWKMAKQTRMIIFMECLAFLHLVHTVCINSWSTNYSILACSPKWWEQKTGWRTLRPSPFQTQSARRGYYPAGAGRDLTRKESCRELQFISDTSVSEQSKHLFTSILWMRALVVDLVIMPSIDA